MEVFVGGVLSNLLHTARKKSVLNVVNRFGDCTIFTYILRHNRNVRCDNSLVPSQRCKVHIHDRYCNIEVDFGGVETLKTVEVVKCRELGSLRV